MDGLGLQRDKMLYGNVDATTTYSLSTSSILRRGSYGIKMDCTY